MPDSEDSSAAPKFVVQNPKLDWSRGQSALNAVSDDCRNFATDSGVIIGDLDCQNIEISLAMKGMKRLAQENGVKSEVNSNGSSNSEFWKSEKMPRQKKGRVLETIWEESSCLEEYKGITNQMMDDGELNVGHTFFDLNVAVPAAAEGSIEIGVQGRSKSGAIVAERIGETIDISSKEVEDGGERLFDKSDSRKFKKIEGRSAEVSIGSSDLELVKVDLGSAADSWLSLDSLSMHFDWGPEAINSEASGSIQPHEACEAKENVQSRATQKLEFGLSKKVEYGLRSRVDTVRNKEILRQNASKFARFNSQGSLKHEGTMSSANAIKNLEDLPGSFATALKIIKGRNPSDQRQIDWKPLINRKHNIPRCPVPSLLDLCTNVLAKNAEAIVSLEYVPDMLKHKISGLLCDSRKMDIHALGLLLGGSPTEIRIKDCSWITEKQFINLFVNIDTSNLKVLQLDLCGQCALDDVLGKTLARTSNSLPNLAMISLRGACRLTNFALQALLAAAPMLHSINLGQCSLLTSIGIDILSDFLGSLLRELYIDDCPRIDAKLIAPALKKFQHLEVLSVAGIQSVCDEFVSEITTAFGQNIKELNLADCLKLTDMSLKAIGNACSGLCSLNISNLHNLTDFGLQYLANGCGSIQTLKLQRNNFSDEAVAAFLEVSGGALKELSLNNIRKVGPNTALSMARCAKQLSSLDLSWCRRITNEALGLIVDSCSSLKLLKLFGCTQINDTFLNGHSNSLVQIIGLAMNPVLEHLHILEHHEALLRYSHLTMSSDCQISKYPHM